MGIFVNDIHSELNQSEVLDVINIDSVQAIQEGISKARSLGVPIAICGGRYAMGGQQFCSNGLVLDTKNLNRVIDFDHENGLIEVEAGIQWPALLDYLETQQAGHSKQWGFAQKQTGADRISIGGTVSANAHGRGLVMKPFVSDVESLKIVSAGGELVKCSRENNRQLFRLVAGGYGLFGCIYSVTIRLAPRHVLERIVELEQIDNLPDRFNERIQDGFLYGDFQFAINEQSDNFLQTGVFSCYRPIDSEVTSTINQQELSQDDWMKLITLAHTDKELAYQLYSEYYLSTSGQLYYSDRHQLAEYLDGYHRQLDEHLGFEHRSSEMISELYVPRERLVDFMAAVRDDFRQHHVDLIYGTIRLIEQDEESFLAWATEPWACVIFNLHTEHTEDGIEHIRQAFCRLIDLALQRGGKYYLTYHKWATRQQVESCYPKMKQFLQLKQQYDPHEVFQSDWYRHYRDMFFE